MSGNIFLRLDVFRTKLVKSGIALLMLQLAVVVDVWEGHRRGYLEVVRSNPARSWAFYLSSPLFFHLQFS